MATMITRKMVLGGRGPVADRDVQPLACLQLIPTEVVEQQAGNGKKPDAEGDHRRPEKERDQRDEEFGVEADEDDDGEASQGRAQAEDLLVDVAQRAGVALETWVLAP
jgi:hypothetical protein